MKEQVLHVAELRRQGGIAVELSHMTRLLVQYTRHQLRDCVAARPFEQVRADLLLPVNRSLVEWRMPVDIHKIACHP